MMNENDENTIIAAYGDVVEIVIVTVMPSTVLNNAKYDGRIVNKRFAW